MRLLSRIWQPPLGTHELELTYPLTDSCHGSQLVEVCEPGHALLRCQRLPRAMSAAAASYPAKAALASAWQGGYFTNIPGDSQSRAAKMLLSQSG